jgi:DNA-binding GntR family transcriptional regulator
MGIVESQRHRGTWVREVSLAETVEALHVRASLDAQAGRSAAGSLRGNCGRLYELVDEIAAAAEREDFGEYQQINRKFHRLIVEAAGSGVLLRVWDSLEFELDTQLVLVHLRDVDAKAVAAEHLAIVEALERGHGGTAARLLFAHATNLALFLEQQEGK